jgi:hypothetical protein
MNALAYFYAVKREKSFISLTLRIPCMRYCSPIRLSATWDIQKKMFYMALYHFEKKFNFQAFLANIVLLKKLCIA